MRFSRRLWRRVPVKNRILSERLEEDGRFARVRNSAWESVCMRFHGFAADQSNR